MDSFQIARRIERDAGNEVTFASVALIVPTIPRMIQLCFSRSFEAADASESSVQFLAPRRLPCKSVKLRIRRLRPDVQRARLECRDEQ